MTLDLQKSLNLLLVLLTISLGLLMGRLSASWVGLSLAPEQQPSTLVATDVVTIKQYRLQDFDVISQRNLFDSEAQPPSVTDSVALEQVDQQKEKAAPAVRTNLKLLGTVAGGDQPLAVIASVREADVYRVGDTLPGNLTLREVQRDRAVVATSAGRETILELEVEKTGSGPVARTAPRATAPSGSVNIIELGENRWQIPREEAEKARSNLNALLKTARMVPKIVNGETQGFTIVSIRAGTFLDLLGLKVGDVLVQINDVELNSPEKALQIFQQVREANNISLGLLRNGSKQTFEYTID